MTPFNNDRMDRPRTKHACIADYIVLLPFSPLHLSRQRSGCVLVLASLLDLQLHHPYRPASPQRKRQKECLTKAILLVKRKW